VGWCQLIVIPRVTPVCGMVLKQTSQILRVNKWKRKLYVEVDSQLHILENVRLWFGPLEWYLHYWHFLFHKNRRTVLAEMNENCGFHTLPLHFTSLSFVFVFGSWSFPEYFISLLTTWSQVKDFTFRSNACFHPIKISPKSIHHYTAVLSLRPGYITDVSVRLRLLAVLK
jgi:hypothetical protein